MIVAEPLAPLGERARYCAAKALAALKLDAVPLAIIETQRFDRFISIQRPGETGGRILATGKQYQRATLGVFAGHRETP